MARQVGVAAALTGLVDEVKAQGRRRWAAVTVLFPELSSGRCSKQVRELCRKIPS